MKKIIKKVKSVLSDKDRGEIAGKSLMSLFLKLSGFIVNYGLLLACTFYSGAKGWGLFAIGFSMTKLLALFCSVGFPNALVKFFADKEVSRSHLLKIAFMISIPISLIVGAAVYFFAHEISSIFNEIDDNLIYAIILSSFSITPITITLVISGFFRANRDMTQYHFFETLGRQLFTLIVYLIWIQFLNEEFVSIFSFLVANWVLALGGLVIVYKKSRENSGFKLLKVREVLGVAVSLHVSKFVNNGIISSTVFILGIFVDRSIVGIYDACYRLANFSSIALLAVNSISASKFAEFSSPESVQKLKKNLRFSGALVFWVSIPVIFFIAVFSYWILKIFGDGFVYGQIALLILLAGQLINNLAGSVGMMMQMTGMHVQFRNINIIVFLMIITLNFILIPIMGINGAALSIATGLIVKNLTAVYLVYRVQGFSSFYLPNIKYLK